MLSCILAIYTFQCQHTISPVSYTHLELNKLNSHPTANEIYEIVRQYIPNISLGTVYRLSLIHICSLWKMT